MDAEALARAQLVVRGHGVEHPYLMTVIVFIVVGVMRIERSGIEFHLRLGFISVEEGFLDRERLRRLICFLTGFRPVVGVAPGGGDDLRGRNLRTDLTQVLD